MIRLSGSVPLVIVILLGLLVTAVMPAQPLQAAEAADAQLFIAGFDAYQGQDYGVAVEKFTRYLKEYPASSLRDMTLYWLARACYHAGDRPQAARTMARFLKEYPAHPLKGTVEAELLTLAAEYDREAAVARAPDAGTSRQATEIVRGPAEKPAPVVTVTGVNKRVAPTVRTAQVTSPAKNATAAPAGPASTATAAGQEGVDFKTIIIKRGDTLVKLAKQHDSSLSRILRLNRIENPDLILIGGTLRVPLPRPSLRPAPLPPPSSQESRR